MEGVIEFAVRAGGASYASAMRYVWLLPPLIALEVLFPQNRVSLLSRLRAGVFLCVFVLLTAITATTFRMLWAHTGVEPLLVVSVPIENPVLRTVTAIIVASVIADFFFYWRHRAQHAFFWRFHAVHHSVRELSAASAYNHWTEDIFRTILTVIPMAFLVSAPEAFLGSLTITLHHLYLHSSTRLHFGPLRLLIGDNRFHRIHHSRRPEHFNKNFSASHPFWDVLFGTAHFPAKDEWPETGLDDQPEPEGVWDYLARPFRPQARPLRPDDLRDPPDEHIGEHAGPPRLGDAKAVS